MQRSSSPIDKKVFFVSRLVFLYIASAVCTAIVLKVIGSGQVNSILVAKNLLLASYFALVILVCRAYKVNLSKTILIAFTLLALGQALGSPLLLFGIMAILVSLCIFRWRTISFSLRLYEYPLLLMFGLLFSLVSISGMQYVTCFIDKTIYGGSIHIDTLFHASISSMLTFFTIPSTGLHGLPLINYHLLSHFFYGSVAKWLNLPVLQVYGSATFLIFIPLLFFSILSFGEEIEQSSNMKSFYIRIWMCFLIFAGFFTFRPGGVFYRFALWDSFLVSESYLISLVLFMGFLSSVISESQKKPAVEWTVWLILLLCAKVSVGMIAFVILMVNMLLTKDQSWISKARLAIIWIMLSCLLGYFLTTRFTPNLKPDFIEKYASHLLHGSVGKVLTVIVFLGIHFFYVWMALLLMFALHISKQKKYVGYNKLLLSLIVSTISGGSVIFIKGLHSAEYYFSNVSMFVAVPIIIVGTNFLFKRSGNSLYQKLPSTIYICCLCLGMIGLSRWGIEYLRTPLKRLLVIKNTATVELPYAPYVRHLEEIRDDVTTLDYLVYVAKDQTEFWSEHNPNPKIPLMIPAVGQRAAIYGLPEPEWSGGLYYWPFYDETTIKTGSVYRIRQETLLQEAMRLGFKGYIDLTKMGWRKVGIGDRKSISEPEKKHE